jgi:hypothetical protein
MFLDGGYNRAWLAEGKHPQAAGELVESGSFQWRHFSWLAIDIKTQ